MSKQHALVACARISDTDLRFTPFMNQRGGNAVSDVYECPLCKRQGRFLQARLKGIACDGQRFFRATQITPLQMEIARLRADGNWPPAAH